MKTSEDQHPLFACSFREPYQLFLRLQRGKTLEWPNLSFVCTVATLASMQIFIKTSTGSEAVTVQIIVKTLTRQEARLSPRMLQISWQALSKSGYLDDSVSGIRHLQLTPIMGIAGLWKLLEPVAKKRSFQHFCVKEGGWVYQACYRHSCTKNLELATLYARCTHLLQLSLNPLFVFDGPDRPRHKRAKHVRGNPHWIERDLKHMLDAFRFTWKDVKLNLSLQLCPSRVSWMQFLWKTLIPSSSVPGQFSDCKSCDGDVSNDEQVIIYRHGIKDCGIGTAFGLAHAGFRHGLSKAIATCSAEDLQMDLNDWHTVLCHEAITNSSKKLPRHFPALAKNMLDHFPSNNILFAYFQPLVSNEEAPCLLNWLQSPPALARFAEEHFTWGDVVGILKHFSTTIYPGLALRTLMQTLNISKEMIKDVVAALHDKGDKDKLKAWISKELPKLCAWVPVVVQQAVG
ncbi:hypothetical protein CPB84DRAFT_1754122 [Gymnopilus junonius]|uniref:Uncharacterized protein n=1 Tax=Gymnopilus junonius TaxID=109634 RepID=A0A9P5NA11_GYMJU|nr:hypothetical protein CPB84DRAFT_1754122 [Gymnopilus junonius]